MPTPTLTWELMSPEERTALVDSGSLAGADKSQDKLYKNAAQQSLDSVSDDVLKQIISAHTEEKYGQFSLEYKKAKAQEAFAQLKDALAKDKARIGEALSIATRKGATGDITNTLPDQEQTNAIDSNKRWNESRSQVIQDLYREGKLDALVKRDFFATQKLIGSPAEDPALEAEIQGRMQTRLLGAQDKGEGWLHSIGEAAQKPARFVSGATAGALEEARLRKLAEDKGVSDHAEVPYLRAAWENANKAATEPSNSASQLASQLQLMQNTERVAATREAQQELRRDPFNRPAIDQLAEQIYGKQGTGITGTFDPIRHPAIAQLAHEVLGDPLMLVQGESIAKGIGKLGSLAEKTRAGKAVAEGFRFVPEAAALRDKLPEAAAMMELAAERGQIGKYEAMGPMYEQLKELQAVPKKYRSVVGEALESGQVEGLSELQRDLSDAGAAGQNLSQLHADYLRKIGEGNRWEGDTLKGLEEVQNYLPHRKLEAVKEAPLIADVRAPERGLNDLEMSSAQMRTSEGAQFSRDPVKQWEAELKQLGPKAQLAEEIRQTKSMFDDVGLWQTFQKGDVELISKSKAAVEAHTGVPWVEMPPNMAQIVDRITGIPGETKLGQQVHLVPLPVAERFNTLLKATNQDHGKAWELMGDLNQQVFRPLSRAWKSFNTLSPMSIANNTVGNVANGYLAKGLRYFNPEVQSLSAGTTLLEAVRASGEGFAVPFELRSGMKTDLRELIKAAREDGILGQFNFRLSLEADRNRTSLVGRGMNSGADFVQKLTSPARKLNELGDDYHKFNIWLSELNGLDPASRAMAAQRTAQLAGNYRRLGAAEKYLRDVVPYYGWLRFVTPFVVKKAIENPSRLADFFKARTAIERGNGQALPTGPEGVPDWLQGFATTAPMSHQPEKLIQLIKSGQMPPPGSHEAAMMVMQDPVTMGLWFLPILEGITGYSHALEPEKLAGLMGPFNDAVLELLTGTNMQTGDPLPDGMLRRFGYSAKQIAARPVKEWGDLFKLYGQSPEAMDLRLRYATGRYFMGMDNWIMEEMGQEGRSIPSYPGAPQYLVNPWQTMLKRKTKAIEELPEIEKSLKQ